MLILLSLWLPSVLASTPNVVVRITPRPSSTPLVGSAPNNYSTFELLTYRAQFGSRDDVSGVLVHAPQSDIFLCAMFNANETLSTPLTQPEQDLIILVPRGYCSFEEKARAAQDLYGAKAILIYDRLSARYQWDSEAQRVIFPQPRIDYECANGEGVLQNLPLDPPAYNGSTLDPLLDMSRTSTSICNLETPQQSGAVCESRLCIVTSHEENSNIYPVCCAWDLPIAMTAGKDSKAKNTKDIVAAFLTIRQAEQVVQTSMLGSMVTIESRSKIFNVSYIFMWMLGTCITIFASWYAGGEYRRFDARLKYMDARQRNRRTNNNNSIAQRRPLARRETGSEDQQSTLEMGQVTPVTADTGSLTEKQAHDAAENEITPNIQRLEIAHEVPLSNMQGSDNSDRAVTEPRDESTDDPQQSVWTLRSLPPPERRRRPQVTTRASVANSQRPQQPHRVPGTMPSFEMTYWHVLIFIVAASLLLVLLFFFQFYSVIFVLYGIGCAGAISYVLFNPLVVCIILRLGDSFVEKFNRILIFQYNGFDLLSQFCAYLWGALWIWYGMSHYKPQQNAFFWISTDIFGACFCILVLSLLKLNSIKIATALMVAVFIYDIFFVFLTPYLTGGDSVMLTVASGGGSGSTFCHQYPEDRNCAGVTFIPMLLIIPKVNDILNGSVILGLGDIVLPGFLIAFCARHDAATRLVGSNSPIFRLTVPNKWHQGFFFPMAVAYSVGLLLAFMAVLLMQQGQPALLYICPIILATMFYLGRKNLKQLWNGAEIFVLSERLMARNERMWDRAQNGRLSTENPEGNLDSPVVESSPLEENGGSARSFTGFGLERASNREDQIQVTTPEIISLDSTSVEPSPDDICFRDQSHPGTQEFVRVVKEANAEFAGDNYSPKIHKKIRAGLRNRRFFKLDTSTNCWVMANKFEVRDEIGLAYDECRGIKSPFFDRKMNKGSP